MQQFQGLIGLAAILLLAWAFSEDRANRPGWRWLGGALLLQLAIAVVVVRVPAVWAAVGVVNQGVAAIEKATLVGSSYMFGYLGGAPLPFALAQGASPPLIIAFQILPLIIVFSALSALLWHWGILKALVRGLSWALRRTLGVSGVVGLGGGGTLFLGVVESPLVLRAWFATMSRSDLFAIMAMIMATISGAILVLYASTLGKVIPNAAGHLIVASLISLPAALMVARLMVPGQPQSTEPAEPDLAYDGAMDAVVRGAMEGVQLMLAVIGIIITIFALVNLADQILALAPQVEGAALTLKRMFGWIFSPLMWAIGVPWDQAPAAGALMGTKAILNEYVAYLDLAALPAGTLDPRSALIVTYALAGFANFGSVGIMVGGLAPLLPEARRADLGVLAMKSVLAGLLATCITAALVGMLY